MNIRIVFMGSPEYALPALDMLVKNYHLIGIVTQPDRPAGRNQRLTPPAVKLFAIERGIPYIQPARLREPWAIEQLHTWHPDLIVVAAFGQILRKEILELPKYGCINIHASLLPRWRGAAPVQAAILHGDRETGATIMLMDAGIDTGPILSQRILPIEEADTAGTLIHKLSFLGADLLAETLPGYITGQIQPMIQDESLATYAPMIKKAEGLLDFSKPASYLVNMVRAYNPWPGAYTTWKGQMLKVLKAHEVHSPQTEDSWPTGSKIIFHNLPAIKTNHGYFVLDEVQLAGKKPVSGNIFLQGARNWTE
jgi:methionyl-tRNA formyltransferase